MPEFFDQKYILMIRDALWCAEPHGRAAVMIGAGFSQNAEPATQQPRRMPLWRDLTQGLVDHLYPASHYSEKLRCNVVSRAGATSGALRLAEEYEAAFGRQQLNQLLLNLIPDADYHPGRLHQLLLQLPWADVFTTNYDTLLERARDEITNRRYEVVRTFGEIAQAMRPRIVKLHGSFPAHAPFIFTEEDFRTYPTRFAPFVNLAQQTMMENIFCLLGFSGDDPNFLYWTGWVRDHLGTSAPRIYLCGLLELNDAQRRLLYQRNVTPIDLSPVVPRREDQDEWIRHRLATEWFLLSLEAGRPSDPFAWPRGVGPRPTEPTPGLPTILGRVGLEPRPERLMPNG
jgi:hypothetical protein